MRFDRLTLSPRKVALAGGTAAVVLLFAVLGALRAPVSPVAEQAPEPERPAAAQSSPSPGQTAAVPIPDDGPDAEPPAGDAAAAGDAAPEAEDDAAASSDGTLDGDDETVEDQTAAAHQAAADFAAGYATHHFDDGPSAVTERVRAFVTDEFASELARNSGAVAASSQRAARQERTVATVQAVQDQGGSVEEGNLHLLVVVRQDVTWDGGSQVRWPTFLVQVVRVGGDWRVARLLP